MWPVKATPHAVEASFEPRQPSSPDTRHALIARGTVVLKRLSSSIRLAGDGTVPLRA